MMNEIGRLSIVEAFGILAGIWFLVVWIACGAFASFVAKSKGRSATTWCILGLLFGPMALLAIAGAARLRTAGPE